MRWFLGVLILCAGLMAAQADQLTPRAFTQEVRSAILKTMPGADLTSPRELELVLRRSDGSFTVISLVNVYGHYKADPKRLSEIIKVYVEGASRPARPVAAHKLDHTRIVPVVKDRAWLAELRGQFAENKQDAVFDALGADLVIVYAEDSEKRTRYLSSLEKLDVPRSELRALAIKNLVRILPKIEIRKHDDVFAMIAIGDYTTSLLLLDEMWSGGQIKFDGDLVIAAPARDVLLITGSRNSKAIEGLRGMARDLAKGPYRLNENLYVYRNGSFAAFAGK